MKKWRKNRVNKAINIESSDNRKNIYYHKILKRIKIKVIDKPIDTALEYYNTLNPDAHVSLSDSKDLLRRLTLNHIRHNYSNYEQLIQQIGTTLYNKIELKQQVNQAIVEKYHLDDYLIA